MPTRPPSHKYELSDVTLVIGARLSDTNPWILARLAWLKGYYRSLPQVLVVDQGSLPKHAQRLQRICEESGFGYFWEADSQPYCPARAKNLGAARASTPLLFFSDADLLGEPRLFERVIEAANQMEFGLYLDQVLTLPTYHLTESATRGVLTAAQPGDALAQVLARAVYSAAGDDVGFVAPYSNCFLCRRDFYDLVGGQNERFRGHGSEDFEFLLRVAVFTGQFPMPEFPQENMFSPTHSNFYGPKPYRGFRRLFELMALQSELLGLRLAHLEHPRPQRGEGWFRDHLEKRAAFDTETAPYLEDPARLVDYDFMPRTRSILVAPHDAASADLLTLLRLDGYRITRTETPRGAGRSGGEAPLVAVAHLPDGRRPELAAAPMGHSDLPRVTFGATAHPDTFTLHDRAASTAGERLIRGTTSHLPGSPNVLRYVAHEFCGRSWKRVALEQPFSPSSYASARLGIGQCFDSATASRTDLSRLKRRVRKLLASPRLFLQDSRFRPVRALERLTRRRT